MRRGQIKCEFTAGTRWSYSAIPDVNLSDQAASWKPRNGSTYGWLVLTVVMASWALHMDDLA